MDVTTLKKLAENVTEFAQYCFAGLTGSRTHRNLQMCVQARLVDARRKTHQPAGAVLASRGEQADGLRQRLNRATLESWSDDVVRQRLFAALPALIPDDVAWVVDDTGFEKKGTKSPGVQRQYSGTAGKITNCQIVVSTHVASYESSVPAEMDVYLPETWCTDAARRAEAGIPDTVTFQTKPEIALSQLDRLIAAGLPSRVVLADAAYGDMGAFRAGLEERNLDYVVGVKGVLAIWRPGEGPEPPPPRRSKTGRAPKLRFPGKYEPVSMKDYVAEIPEESYEEVCLETGRHSPVHTRFVARRVRTAHRARAGRPPGPEVWLLAEWPPGEPKPTRFFLSNLPADAPVGQLAQLGKLRWRIERNYQDLKQEVGLAHYEGRRWRGLNHHLTICMVAFAFLAARRRFFFQQAPAVNLSNPPPTSS